jgi:hypothetical protein
MWSNEYYYFNIYKDKNLSADFDTKKLQFFLDTLPELKKAGDFCYKNNTTFPFTEFRLLFANSNSNYSSNDTNPIKTNLLPIVCSKYDKDNFDKYKSLFIKIASFLNWQFVDECTDDDIEDFVIWKPEEDSKL